MKPLQQILEQAVAIILFLRASHEGAVKRCRYSGLIGQAFDTDDTPVHVKLSCRLLHFSFAGHLVT
jgi:hypothetical protein